MFLGLRNWRPSCCKLPFRGQCGAWLCLWWGETAPPSSAPQPAEDVQGSSHKGDSRLREHGGLPWAAAPMSPGRMYCDSRKACPTSSHMKTLISVLERFSLSNINLQVTSPTQASSRNEDPVVLRTVQGGGCRAPGQGTGMGPGRPLSLQGLEACLRTPLLASMQGWMAGIKRSRGSWTSSGARTTQATVRVPWWGFQSHWQDERQIKSSRPGGSEGPPHPMGAYLVRVGTQPAGLCVPGEVCRPHAGQLEPRRSSQACWLTEKWHRYHAHRMHVL